MAFSFGLEDEDGLPAEPPTRHAAVPTWRRGDTIHLGRGTLRVTGIRDEDDDETMLNHAL
jgi:hypothetical protein